MNPLSILKLFKPAEIQPEIKDSNEIKSTYKYWRIRIFYSIYFGYVFYYFTRKSFTFAMPLLVDDLGFSMSDLGILGTVLYITYGISKFISGILSDRANPRYFMSIGLILTGITNIIFGFSSSIVVMALIWGVNGIFQGWGWPPCTKQLTFWFSRKERGILWSINSTSHNVGGALIPLWIAIFATGWGWRWSMWLTGIISIICGLWLINRLRDIPQTLGLPPVEKDDQPENSTSKEKPTPGTNQKKTQTLLSPRQILFEHVLNNSSVWILACSYFFVYVVRTSVNDWGALYLIKTKGYSLVSASASITWFEIGGFFGVLAAGWFSDKVFGGRRLPYMIYCSLCLLISIGLFGLLPPGYVILDSVCMSGIGFFIFGPQMLVGLAAAEIVDKKAACTANGFAGCFAYIGAAATGYPLGKIIDIWKWEGFFVVLLISSAITCIVLISLNSIKSSPVQNKHASASKTTVFEA